MGMSDPIHGEATEPPEPPESPEPEEETDERCLTCNGSGEGMADGTRCWQCRGSGSEGGWRTRPQNDPDDYEEKDESKDSDRNLEFGGFDE